MDKTLEIFHIEANELLEEMESALICLERSPSDLESLNSVFRAAHTIKGSAGVVGLGHIEDFTHRVESLLVCIREGQSEVNEDIIEMLLESRDHIAELVAGIADRSADPEGMAERGKRLSTMLSGTIDARADATQSPERGSKEAVSQTYPSDVPGVPRSATGNWHISLRFCLNSMRNGMDPISFISYLDRIGRTHYLKTIWDFMPQASDMDPESCYLGFEIDFQSHVKREAIEEVFEFLEEDCRVNIIAPGSPVSQYIALIDSLPEDNGRLMRIFSEGGALGPEDTGPGKTAATSCAVQTTKDLQPDHIDDDLARKKTSTIRVDIDKLDSLVNAVGELVVSGASIKQEADRLRKRRLSGLTDNLLRLIDDIRESTMSVRMTPVLDTFNRFRRMVRDMCHETGKEVEISISGGETELDRNVIEQIKDPLVHLVRNAVDHGIELPEERLQKGKPRAGRLLLNAYQETGDIIIEVADDGRGLDRDAIVAKAVENGTIQRNEALTDEQIKNLIFEPGVSTAGQVTNISGRGVGMDVVRRNIEDLRGSVSIMTRQAEGMSVKVRLPLTLAIIEGFLVSVGSTSFVVPMDMVVECLELTEADRRAAHGRDHIELRGHVLPYIRLRSVFDIDEDSPDHEHILVVRHSGRSVGLLVDRLAGEISTVIKTLGRYYRDVEGISGATIMGDGSVALIVDVPNLVRSAMDSVQ